MSCRPVKSSTKAHFGEKLPQQDPSHGIPSSPGPTADPLLPARRYSELLPPPSASRRPSPGRVRIAQLRLLVRGVVSSIGGVAKQRSGAWRFPSQSGATQSGSVGHVTRERFPPPLCRYHLFQPPGGIFYSFSESQAFTWVCFASK